MKHSILFVGPSLNIGGAGKMIQDVANGCIDIFDKVYITSIHSKEYPNAIYDGVSFKELDIKNAPSSLQWRFEVMRTIRDMVRSLRVSVICSFVSEVAVMARIATLGIRNVKVISAERGDPYTLPLLWKILVRWTYRTSDYCFFQLERARDFFGNSVRARSFIIPNSIVPEKCAVPYFGQRKKTIVAAGRFAKEKGFESLIEAFAVINKKHPEYKLIIYGEGELENFYKEKTKQLGISEYVYFPGYVDNVSERISRDGIFVLPSLYEGIPNVLIEALTVGIPCIASDCSPGGPAFLLENGQRGLLFPINNVKELVKSLSLLIEDNDLALKFNKRGPQIKNVLDESIIRKKWVDAFMCICKSL